MSRSVVVAVLFSILPSLASAQEVARSQQTTHEVVRGETLWTLAERYYGNPYRWPLIYEANRGRITNPDQVESGQHLIIPEVEQEKPDPGNREVAAQIQDVTVVAQAPMVISEILPPPTQGRALPLASEGIPVPCPGRGDRTLFFPREGERRECAPQRLGLRRTLFYARGDAQGPPREMGAPPSPGRADAVTTSAVPLGLVYAAEWLVSPEDEVGFSGTLSGFSHLQTVRASDGPARVSDRLIIEPVEGARLRVGDLLQSFREHREERRLGSVQQPSGVLVVTEVGGGGIVATVSSEFSRIWIGDRVRSAPLHRPRPGIFPIPVESDLMGTVLGFPEDRPVQGFGARIFLDIGSKDGVDIGDIFRASVEEDGPNFGIEVARIQIVLVEAEGSTGRVVTLKHPNMGTGTVLRLIAKMQ